MYFWISCTALAALLLVALPAFLPAQYEASIESAQRRSAMRQLPAQFEADGFTASELLGTPVRDDWGRPVGDVEDIIVGVSGKIEKMVAEVGGFLDAGDQHIGVPWKDVQVGPELRWVQVPLVEVENDTYSLGGRAPQGEDVIVEDAAWRVSDLMGGLANIKGEERPVLVADVVFGREAEVLAVIVQRGGDYVGPGWQRVRPYAGYRRGRYAYDLAAPPAPPRFEYMALEKLRRFADDADETGTGNHGRGR